MRIALIVPGFSVTPDDWAIPAVQTFTCALAQQHQVTVFSLRHPPRGVYHFDVEPTTGYSPGGCLHFTHWATGGGRRFGLASLLIWQQTWQAILRQHRRTPFDLLHAFWADESGLTAGLAAAGLRRPVLLSLGGGELTYLPDIGYGTQGSFFRRLVVRQALRRADLVTAGSPYQRELALAHGVAPDKLRLAPLGVDTSRFRPQPTPGGRSVLLQVASLIGVKNQALLLHVLKRVKEEIPSVQLRLVGDGPLHSSLVALAHELQIATEIDWRGRVPYPATPHVYQDACLYLQSSRHESQGMAVLEAMACGVPALGTPVGILREVAARPPQVTAEGLAAQVVELLADSTRLEELRQQARQTIEERFSLPVAMETFFQLYEELLEAG
ncbi:MAG: glycosyltransferase family 4 protein [Chloroflexota bacterium]